MTGHTTAQKTQTVQATSFSPSQRFFIIFPSAPGWAFYPRATWPPFDFPVKAWPQSPTVQHSLPCLWASSDILHNFSPYGQHSFIPHGSLGAGGCSRLLAHTRRLHARGHFIPWGTTMKRNSSKKQPQKKCAVARPHARERKMAAVSPRKGSSNVQLNSSAPVFNTPVPCLRCFPGWGCYPQDHSSSPNHVTALRSTFPSWAWQASVTPLSNRMMLHRCPTPAPSWLHLASSREGSPPKALSRASVKQFSDYAKCRSVLLSTIIYRKVRSLLNCVRNWLRITLTTRR